MDAARHSRHRELLLLVADPRRWTILQLLGESRLTVTELVEHLDIAQPAVSHHLARLREAGLVECVAEGRTRRYGWARAGPESPQSDLQILLRSWSGSAPAVVTDRGNGRRSRPPGNALEVHLL